MTGERSIPKESGIHGERWHTLHNGYFSDPDVALPFVDAIASVINISRPAAIADLGGGTCFILEELQRRCNLQGVSLLNVDISPRQLSVCHDEHIALIQASADRVTRQQLQVEDGKLLLIARSVLHYFGRSDIRPFLMHIRSQLKVGEFFIHQSACFQHSEDAECLNLIYDRMGTDKWYGTVSEMEVVLKDEGWEICSVDPAPKLRLSSDDLSERYSLIPNQIQSMKAEVEKRYGQKPDIFIITDEGFSAWLRYCIFVCKAI